MHALSRGLNRGVHAAWRLLCEAAVIAPGTHAGEKFGTLGEASCIDFPPLALLNTQCIHIGRGTLIGRHATLSVGYGAGDTTLPPRGLVIGERCVIGARSTITAHESIEIGDSVFFAQSVFVTDASHGYQDPHVPIGEQFGTHQPVSIGSGSWIGHAAVILPGSRLGRNVVVAAGAVVRGEVPDHTVVAGNPARPIRQLEPGVGWVGTGDPRPVLAIPLGLRRVT